MMYKTLDEEITNHVEFVAQQTIFQNYIEEREWEEVEHTDVSLNPVFIAIYDTNFKLVENSPNLVQNRLDWNPNKSELQPYYILVNQVKLLVSQAKLLHNGSVVGYVVIGVSTKHNDVVVDYIEIVLLVIFPLVVIVIFLLARLIASKAIQPVFNVIETAQSISENNLNQRISLPSNKDELYQLTKTINSLLDRLEFQIVRAKQFSSDASHELRTPLSIIKGNLELLNRKERSIEEYQEKVNYTLVQVDRLYNLVEQFLLLSRVENNSIQLQDSTFNIQSEIELCLKRFDFLRMEKKIDLQIIQIDTCFLTNKKEFLEIILDNIISNSIKFSPMNGKIEISGKIIDNEYVISVKDFGIGIKEKDIELIKNRFFRIQDDIQISANGYGLGLDIASKLAKLSKSEVIIKSQYQKGTEVLLRISTKLD